MAKKYYPRKAKDTPNRTELAAEQVEEEILSFWSDIGKAKLTTWEKPWILNAFQAENAGKFVNDGERYTYKGGFNQFLIGLYTAEKETTMAPLIMNRTDMAKIFGVEDFGKTPVVQEGIKSIGSIFNRPVDKIVGRYWEKPDGSRWSSDDPTQTKPTSQEIRAQDLTEKKLTKAVYQTFPVWSVEDIYHVLPDEEKNAIQNLLVQRQGVAKNYSRDEPINNIIRDKVDDLLDRAGLPVFDGANRAAYYPKADKIEVPRAEQFDNPIERLATVAHELAHSTKHLLGRNAFSTNKIEYAREELVAETVAVLVVKQFQNDINDIVDARNDIRQLFDDYYQNSMMYQKGWGHTLKFQDLVDDIVKQKQEGDHSIIKNLLVDIGKAYDSLQNQTYGPEQRLEALTINVAKKERELALQKPKPSEENLGLDI